MINQIILFSIKNKLVIGLLTIALVAAGVWSMFNVPLDAVPDITNNQVQVITQTPNLGTEDIEQFVTYPVELAMSNLPGVTEIRSISRFGLSVVTIVFEDDMGTYLPRQLVSEKLTEIKEEIPKGFGEPSMGPISTGLGEIYQYILTVAPEFKDEYSYSDLRTMQDWIVRRQMAMVEGVVEINAVGGDVKQYEISINPNQLKAIGVTIVDVLKALEDNNQNTGGAYIEKNHMANFIRGEGLLRSIDDIENIVLKSVNGLPITIADIATVRYGKAVRYGALTQDGQGEVVGGIVMMLKGANSNEVINAVKERMKEIEKSLPEGVTIEPLLDRSKLIGQTTKTVSTNLAEGALIVIFVLVILLGNWRGGLIVASTIPLSLLFAFVMMNIFGVWANLMSLGAIDFGIIIDGAVIIVESTVYLINEKIIKKQRIGKGEIDEITFKASSKMMNTAFFGQLIILIVFLPILALEGIEGKMFKPMALTFMFAMGGVMILCLTYVPMMSALLLGKTKAKVKKSIGDKIIASIERTYDKVLVQVMKKAEWLIIGSLLALALSVYTFTQMGAVFVPQLDEGDIAFHAILKPGSSLGEMIETTTRVEQIVLEKFPEVEKIVSRIGVAEIPTDPMPMDVADIFVILKPQSEWVSAQSKDELVEKMKSAVEIIPGVNYEFSQPIEMRFNELLEGVREDIAIKLYGDDLSILSEKANEISKIIAGTPGIGDMKAEATSGLPQMTIKYKRHKLAQYGLNVSELNQIVRAAFAGQAAGVIFEGEKRFDMVVRLASEHRKSIDDIKQLFVPLENGTQIPLSEVAEVSYSPGPMQISRDNTNRRTYVGINVRGRDIKSLVAEIKDKLDSQLELPTGYYIRYGGAFENLERATSRLKIVVPISLALIFLLIYFALKSFKQTSMIYMAIPLAAIGGVFSLYLRDMPFSISAGVGFIVLFGVAVLNGIVLISGWNELKEEGVEDLDERIRLGTKRRIRPIMLTALTDIFGFLPMAVSRSAGAEVQQPLATVVIGGMLTATLLTLFILPILYRWTESKNTINFKPSAKIATAILLIISFAVLSPQLLEAKEAKEAKEVKVITELEDAIAIALENNGNLRTARLNLELEKTGTAKALNIDKTNVGVQLGQYSSFENDFSFEIEQGLEFPTVYTSRYNLADQRVIASGQMLEMTEKVLIRNIRTSWYELSYLSEKQKLLVFLDKIYKRFLQVAKIRYQTEASTYLENVTAQTKVMEIENELKILISDINIKMWELSLLLNSGNDLVFKPNGLGAKVFDDSYQIGEISNPAIDYAKQKIEIAKAEHSVQVAKIFPDFSIAYFNQTLIGGPLEGGGIAGAGDRFSGVKAGISLPLFFGSYSANIESAKIKEKIAKSESDYFNLSIKNKATQQVLEVQKYKKSLDFYNEMALPNADLIINNSQKSFESGEIDYLDYFQSLNQGVTIKINYLNTLNEYNQAVISLEYLINQ